MGGMVRRDRRTLDQACSSECLPYTDPRGAVFAIRGAAAPERHLFGTPREAAEYLKQKALEFGADIVGICEIEPSHFDQGRTITEKYAIAVGQRMLWRAFQVVPSDRLGHRMPASLAGLPHLLPGQCHSRSPQSRRRQRPHRQRPIYCRYGQVLPLFRQAQLLLNLPAGVRLQPQRVGA